MVILSIMFATVNVIIIATFPTTINCGEGNGSLSTIENKNMIKDD